MKVAAMVLAGALVYGAAMLVGMEWVAVKLVAVALGG